MSARVRIAAIALLAVTMAAPARAQAPDADWRLRLLEYRAAVRDTVGHSDDAVRLAALGEHLMQFARTEEAESIWRRVEALRPGDITASGNLGRLALVTGRLEEADRWLSVAAAGAPDGAYARDRFLVALRRGDYRAAATLAEAAGEGGRIASLEHFAADPPLRLRPGADSCRVPFRELYPLAMVRAKLLREIMLFAVDTGAPCLLLDQSAARRLGVRLFEGRGQIAWLGTMHAVTYGVVPSFELGDFTLENVPVAVLPLRKYSAAVHGAKEPVAGVIGVELLRAFTPTLDYPEHELVLRRRTLVAAAAATPVSDGGTVENAVPLEIWSESELMVRGRVRDSRPLALWLHSGFPECGFGASAATLDELSLSAGGGISRAIRGAATVLRGNAWARVQIPSISIGRLREGPVSGWSGALDGALATRHGLGRDGFISHDLFRDWRVTIDWDASRVRFDPEK